MKKFKSLLKSIWKWKVNQFKTHTLRSLVITISVVAFVTVGILWFGGAFAHHYSYLPNRTYVLAPMETTQPQTLAELLYSSTPNVDTLLRNPAIAEEIIDAKSLTELVDSRFSLNNLRELERQIKSRLEQAPEDVYLLDLPADEIFADMLLPLPAPFPNYTLNAAASLANAEEQSITTTRLSYTSPQLLTLGSQFGLPGSPALPISGKAAAALTQQTSQLTQLVSAMERLLIPSYAGDKVTVDPAINIKGIWQAGEALIHMTPAGDWLPEDGYDLYRIIDGEKTLIKSQAASPKLILSGASDIKFPITEADMSPFTDTLGNLVDEEGKPVENSLKEIYRQAELSANKRSDLGMTVAQFRQAFYATDTLEEKTSITGARDFALMKENFLSVPAGIEQKIPENDLLLSQPIYVMERQPNGMYANAKLQSSMLQKLAVEQNAVLARNYVFFAGLGNIAELDSEQQRKFELARSIMDARLQITTMSFANKEFAEEAEFLIHDDLSALDLPEGTVITYLAQVPDSDISASLELIQGVELQLSSPTGLDGFGIDGMVPLRWDEAAAFEESSIIIGYDIERKLAGESGFSRINETPVAISYMEDDSGCYMESVVFYEDAVDNGRAAEYRVCARDIFGRSGAYSDVLKLKVEKITPPNAPSLATPELSTRIADELTGNASAAFQASVQQNQHQKGILLPISTESSDTARFTVYRAEALGAESFGKARLIADIEFDNQLEDPRDAETAPASSSVAAQKPAAAVYKLASTFSTTTSKKIKQLAFPLACAAEPNLVYFDADVEEGYTYKYWVSAWDDPEWNNESAWSSSVTIGFPTKSEPTIPSELTIRMLSKKLPDYSALAPGIVLDGKLTEVTLHLSIIQDLPLREYAADADTATMEAAEAAGVSIGSFLPANSLETTLPTMLSLVYDNLPPKRYIHTFAAVLGDNVKANGSAYLNWPAYSGSGLNGYVVYKPVSATLPPLEIMQNMSQSELVQMCTWYKVSNAIKQNQLLVSGLNNAPGSVNLFLICLEPEENIMSAKAATSHQTQSSDSKKASEPENPKKPTLEYLNVNVPGTVTVNSTGIVTVKLDDGSVFTFNTNATYISGDYYSFMKYRLYEAADEAQNNPNPQIRARIATVLSAYINAFNAAIEGYTANLDEYEAMLAEYEAAMYLELISGHVEIHWEKPDDPQIKYYRVYRREISKAEYLNMQEETEGRSEGGSDGTGDTAENIMAKKDVRQNFDVMVFKETREHDSQWSMVGDMITATQFTDPVEQSFAHYYIYKVTAVTMWGVESKIGREQAFRVPATIPPATPNMQIPLSAKNGVKINFSQVDHCEKYVLYRTEITRLSEEQIEKLMAGNEDIFGVLFKPVSLKDTFLTQTTINSFNKAASFSGAAANLMNFDDTSLAPFFSLLGTTLAVTPGAAALSLANDEISTLTKFKTVSQIDKVSLHQGLAAISKDKKQRFIEKVLSEYGPLVLADYCDLSYDMMKRVIWQEVGLLTVSEDTEENSGGSNLDLLEQLYIEDKTVKYGHRYLYTVRAFNDDNLGSMASEPVKGTPRRNGPFDSIHGIAGQIVDGQPRITWNPPNMVSAGLTVEECKQDTVGYIVYRADKQEGPYYQASPLLFNTNWVDTNANIYSNNWYNVKVLDTGGYLSEFGVPVNIHLIYTTNLSAFIPIDLSILAPTITVEGSPFAVEQGMAFSVPYDLAGDEPIAVSLSVLNNYGGAALGFTVNSSAQTINAPHTLDAGTYTVTATAQNEAGEDSAIFTLEVTAKAAPPIISFREAKFTIQQGSAFFAPYTLSGTEPITVIAAAINERGAAVSGFTVNKANHAVSAPANLTVGTYTITATAKNSVGENIAAFTLEVTALATPPMISFAERRYTTEQGTALKIPYTLAGTEPIAVTVEAKNANGSAAIGFTINTATKEITVYDRVAAGMYTITATAKNSAGESTAAFTLEVTAALPEPTPLVILMLKDQSFTVKQGENYQARYIVMGMEPITVTVEAVGPDGSTVSGYFSVDALACTVNAISRLPAGVYTVTVTAVNAGGKSSDTFTLTVEAPTLTAPIINKTMVMKQMTQGTDYTVQFSASGSEPLTWMLEPIWAVSHIATVPNEASIDNTGMLTIKGSIAVGDYSFIIRVINSVGSDTLEFSVSVQAGRQQERDTQLDQRNLELLIQSSASLSLVNVSCAAVETAPSYAGFSGLTGAEFTLLSDTFSNQPPLQQTQPTADMQLQDTMQLQQTTVTPQAQRLNESYQKSMVWCGQFTLKDVRGSRPAASLSTPSLIKNIGYSGTAMMDFGYDELLPVKFVNAIFADENSLVGSMVSGTVYLPEPHKFANIGLTLVSLEFSPGKNTTATVSGYMESITAEQNLIGDLGVLEFKDANLVLGTILIRNNLPHIRYEQFTFYPRGIEIIINSAWSGDTSSHAGITYIELSGRASLKSHLETLDNKDIDVTIKSNVRFDLHGKIVEGKFETSERQSFQLLVPGGAMLRIEKGATFSYQNGQPENTGKLEGRLILPFENPAKFSLGQEVQGEYAYEKPLHNMMLIKGDDDIEEAQNAIIHFGETVQSQGLLIVPRDEALQDLCAYASLNVYDWTGGGFVTEHAPMSQVNVTDRSLPVNVGENDKSASQRKQGMKLSASLKDGVKVDLSRNSSLIWNESYPDETGEDFWVGIIYSEGTISLPPGYIRTKEDTTVDLKLSPGQMIYDLNGFNYQKYLYSSTPEGVAAKTGKELGNFPNVWIHDVMLDLYNNKVDFEVNMTVAVDFLMGNTVEAKLYTLKEPDEFGNLPGAFLCSVAPTLVKSAVAPMFDMRIDGGFFESTGMRIHGALFLPAPEFAFDVQSKEALEFTDLLIPADRDKTKNSMKYGYVSLDKAVNVDFNGFTVKVRVLDLQSSGMKNDITLQGATVLSDNIPLSTENSDFIVMHCRRPGSELWAPVGPNNLVVDFAASTSALNTTFDDCFTVKGTLTPQKSAASAAFAYSSEATPGPAVATLLSADGLGGPIALSAASPTGNGRFVEYETGSLDFGFLDALDCLPFTTETRFGVDTEAGRNYFAIGLTGPSTPFEFGAGQIRNVCGIVIYNMNVERAPDLHDRFYIPANRNEMESYIKKLTPNTEGETVFAAAISGTLNIEHLCEIRKLYFAFQSGPIVEAGGDFYIPCKPGAIFGGDLYTQIGSVVIMYNHPNRHFSINVDVDVQMLGIDVYGNICMQYNPRLFGVYLGYPEMLAAKITPFKAGAGFAFQVGDIDSFIAAKVALGLDYDLPLGIVYIGGYLEAGAEGEYHFTGGDFILILYLKGGIKGGVIAPWGKRYNIINFYLGAQGTLSKGGSSPWKLAASCEVGYSLKLFLFKVGGTVHADFKKNL